MNDELDMKEWYKDFQKIGRYIAGTRTTDDSKLLDLSWNIVARIFTFYHKAIVWKEKAEKYDKIMNIINQGE